MLNEKYYRYSSRSNSSSYNTYLSDILTLGVQYPEWSVCYTLSLFILRSGYQAASKRFVEADLDVDCTGKVFMITGANSGIGKCIATAAAKRGGTVHMVCRNPTLAEAAKDELKTDTKNEVGPLSGRRMHNAGLLMMGYYVVTQQGRAVQKLIYLF